MKCILSFLLLLISYPIFAQLNFYELTDLNSIVKKEDFVSVKKFLINKGYEITTDNENYDHGSYYVIADINAKIKIGERMSEAVKGTYLQNIYDEIEINCHDFSSYKKFYIKQSISSDKEIDVLSRKFQPVYSWISEKWDMLRDISNREKYDFDNNSFKEYFYSPEFKNKDYVNINLIQNNRELGETKKYSLYYYHKYYELNYPNNIVKKRHTYTHDISLETLQEKGSNIKEELVKYLSFPLIKSGSSYIIKLQFGNIIKRYILDSGASETSIDREILTYLQTSKLLSNENYLTPRTFVLADGSTTEFERLKIPFFRINDTEIKNIRATIVENGQPLLLGKSFLDSFKSWKVDNITNTLLVEKF